MIIRQWSIHQVDVCSDSWNKEEKITGSCVICPIFKPSYISLTEIVISQIIYDQSTSFQLKNLTEISCLGIESIWNWIWSNSINWLKTSQDEDFEITTIKHVTSNSNYHFTAFLISPSPNITILTKPSISLSSIHLSSSSTNH